MAGERMERLVAIPADEARRRIRMLNCRQGGRADERRRRRDGDDRAYRNIRYGGHYLRPPSSSAAGDGHSGPYRRGCGHDSPTYRSGRSGPPSRDSHSPGSSAAGDGHPRPSRRSRSRDSSSSDGGRSIPPRRPPRSSGSRASRQAESRRRWDASGTGSSSSSPERDDAPPAVRVRAVRTREAGEGYRPADYRPTSVSSTTSEVELDVSSDHLESDADRGRWTDVSLLDLDIDVADLEMPPVIAMRDAEVMADKAQQRYIKICQKPPKTW